MIRKQKNVASSGFSGSDAGSASPLSSSAKFSSSAQWLSVAGLTVLVMAAVLRPADSIEVEQGAALFLLPVAVFAWLLSLIGSFQTPQSEGLGGWWRRLLSGDSEVWFGGLLVAFLVWMGVAAVSVSGVGDLRQAANEWWWWVTCALGLVASRRCCADLRVSRVMVCLLMAIAVGLCAYAAHQQWVSLPNDRARYEADPDAVLEMAGIDAPPGSTQRMLFESRLYGGGVSATFALANSLAGILVMAFPLTLGFMFGGTSVRGVRWNIGVGIACGISLLMVLVWTDSRSAYLSLMLGVFIGAVHWCFSGRWFSGRKLGKGSVDGNVGFGVGRWLYLGFFGLGIVSSIVSALSPGLWSLAPRSLAFRFQYWRATLSLLNDHRWVGAGPGNFQQRYGLYRLDEASETIADPHNWFMEILGAGGIIAGLIFILLAVVGVLGLWKNSGVVAASGSVRLVKGNIQPLVWAVVFGGAMGFSGVVVYWITAMQPFDFDALMLFVLIGGVCFFVLVWLSRDWDGESVGTGNLEPGYWPMMSWEIAALSTLGIHLFASGGLTVPGIAVPAIVLVGMLVPMRNVDYLKETREVKAAWRLGGGAWLKIALALLLVICWQVTAWWPSSASDRLAESAGRAIAVGQVEQGLAFYREAVEADVWDPNVAVAHSEALLWLALSADSEERAEPFRERWELAIEEAVERDPQSGQLRELRARQNLLLYQRFGADWSLRRAEESLREAVALGPTEESWVAQLAAVAWELGEPSEAKKLRKRTETLSLAGGHEDRRLDVIRVLVVEFLGPRFLREGPASVTAEELFRSFAADDAVMDR